jgi:hypothetical protein
MTGKAKVLVGKRTCDSVDVGSCDIDKRCVDSLKKGYELYITDDNKIIATKDYRTMILYSPNLKSARCYND